MNKILIMDRDTRMRKSLLALAVMGSLAGVAAGAPMMNNGPRLTMNQTKPSMRRRIVDAFGHSVSYGGKSAGVSMAKQKRNSIKTRNRKRNKALK